METPQKKKVYIYIHIAYHVLSGMILQVGTNISPTTCHFAVDDVPFPQVGYGLVPHKLLVTNGVISPLQNGQK